MTALVTADPEKDRHGLCLYLRGLASRLIICYDGSDNLQAPGQAPINANGLFNGAHDLIFYQPVMNSINEAKEQGMEVLSTHNLD